MRKAYRIISIEAADIYRQEQENGGSVGYKMPESKSDAYFKLFKIYLDTVTDRVIRTGKKKIAKSANLQISGTRESEGIALKGRSYGEKRALQSISSARSFFAGGYAEGAKSIFFIIKLKNVLILYYKSSKIVGVYGSCSRNTKKQFTERTV